MKVLIVEDEYYARIRLMKMVIEWDSSVIITGDVETGIEAITSINHEEPDLILTDIRMPEMDGLELSRYVMDNHPSVFVAILSGYADFEYAQKALGYNVKRYILKPIKKEDLHELLNELKGKWEERNSERQQFDSILRRMVSYNLIWKLASAIFEQNRLVESFSEIFKLRMEPVGYWVIIFKSYTPLSEGDCESLESQLKNLLQSEPNRDGFGFFNPLIKNEWIGICFTFSTEAEENYEGASKHSETVLRNIRSTLTERFSIGVSRLHIGTASLSIGYSEAKYALTQHLCRGTGHLFEYGNPIESIDYEWKDQIGKKFHQELKVGKAVMVKKLIYSLFMKVREENHTCIWHLHQLYSSIDAIIRSEINERMIPEVPKKGVDEFATLEQLVDELSIQVERLYDRLPSDELKEGEKQELINDLIAYVRENYACEISLDVLAKHRYYLNPSYLSRLFKSKTGQGFSEFLTGCRMKKAKDLIETDWFIISEIAGLVGYTTPSHFIQVFKKYYGETPGEYKSSYKDVKKPI